MSVPSNRIIHVSERQLKAKIALELLPIKAFASLMYKDEADTLGPAMRAAALDILLMIDAIETGPLGGLVEDGQRPGE